MDGSFEIEVLRELADRLRVENVSLTAEITSLEQKLRAAEAQLEYAREALRARLEPNRYAHEIAQDGPD
jgi:hypothetical protein